MASRHISPCKRRQFWDNPQHPHNICHPYNLPISHTMTSVSSHATTQRTGEQVSISIEPYDESAKKDVSNNFSDRWIIQDIRHADQEELDRKIPSGTIQDADKSFPFKQLEGTVVSIHRPYLALECHGTSRQQHESRYRHTELRQTSPNILENQPRYHRTVYTTFRSHRQSYPTESQTNHRDNPLYPTTPYDSLVPVTMNVSDQPLRLLYRASDTPRPTNGTYKAGRWKTKLDKHR